MNETSEKACSQPEEGNYRLKLCCHCCMIESNPKVSSETLLWVGLAAPPVIDLAQPCLSVNLELKNKRTVKTLIIDF